MIRKFKGHSTFRFFIPNGYPRRKGINDTYSLFFYGGTIPIFSKAIWWSWNNSCLFLFASFLFVCVYVCFFFWVASFRWCTCSVFAGPLPNWPKASPGRDHGTMEGCFLLDDGGNQDLWWKITLLLDLMVLSLRWIYDIPEWSLQRV